MLFATIAILICIFGSACSIVYAPTTGMQPGVKRSVLAVSLFA
jgi:hypothetical protein